MPIPNFNAKVVTKRGTVIEVRLLHPAKHLRPKALTSLGMVMEGNCVVYDATFYCFLTS